jgi:sigma-B regulation protein RsbU (phosphoserine phosphatase)
MATSSNFTAPLPSSSRLLDPDQLEDLLKLQKAAQKISSILDLDQLVDKVVNDIARSFGCLDSDIYLHNVERGELSLVCAHGCDGCELCGPGHSLKIGKGMVGYVASTGHMHYAPDVRLDPYYIGCEELTLSEVAIPLHVEGQLVGVFTASHTDLDAFTPCQLRLLQALCCDVAVAVHNARRFQQELRQREQMTSEAREARVIQQALLPKASPSIPGFTVSGLSIPVGAVGGDWYDFIPMDKGRWGLVLADVSGKGTAAALLMSATRGILRSLAGAACTPGEVLTKLNRLLVEDFPAGRFVTMVYGVLDPVNRTLTFANAGHLPPLLISGTSSRFLDVERGIPLGLGRGDFSEVEVKLPLGSRLLFYSDGITEAENPADEEYGLARLQEHFLRTDASAESLLDNVRSFADGAGLRDDASVILVKG